MNDSNLKKSPMITTDDSQSISRLLQLLELRLDRHVDDSRYVFLIATAREGIDTGRIETTSPLV